MPRIMTCAAVVLLTGCASMGEWRTLSLDGNSDEAFEQSVAQLNGEMPYTHRQLLSLALVDIARTGHENAERDDDGESTYTYEQYRSDLHGLTYDGVIALADQSGIPVVQQFNARRSGRALTNAGFPNPNQGQPAFTLDGQPVPQPGMPSWPLGADERGRALYPPQ